MKEITKKLLPSIGLLLLLAGCSDSKTAFGNYEYVVHKDAPGETPKAGEFVYFQADIMAGDRLLQNSRRNRKKEIRLELPDLADASGLIDPVMALLYELSPGDSASVYMSLDSFPQPPVGLGDVDELTYNVAVYDVKSPAEHQVLLQEEAKMQQAERAALKAKEANAKEMAQSMAADYRNGALKDRLTTLNSGLKYLIVEEGTGEQPDSAEFLRVNYFGVLTDGTEFDNSFKRGDSFGFDLGAEYVIKGWNEGVPLLRKGSIAFLFIPPELGYGKAGYPGRVPEDAELIFYLELLED